METVIRYDGVEYVTTLDVMNLRAKLASAVKTNSVEWIAVHTRDDRPVGVSIALMAGVSLVTVG